MSQAFPEASPQNIIGSFWQTTTGGAIERGRLIRTIVPYPDMKPLRLTIEGRGDDARQHERAQVKVEEFRVGGQQQQFSQLPVAGLPEWPGETHVVRRGKIRPVVVIALPGVPVQSEFKRHGSRWQYASSVLVAPYYGCASDGTRAGWHPEFVARIQKAEYSQYIWDVLPVGGSEDGSVLRIDHIFPVGFDSSNWMLTEYMLRPEAMSLLDDWVSWHLTGLIPPDSMLELFRETFQADRR